MKISELIAGLEKFKASHGDLPVALKETTWAFDGDRETAYETLGEGWLAVDDVEFEDVEYTDDSNWVRRKRVPRKGSYLIIDATTE